MATKPPGYGAVFNTNSTGNPLLDAFTQARADQTQAALQHAQQEAERYKFEHQQKMDAIRSQLEEDHLKYLQDNMAQNGQQFNTTQQLARDKFEADKTQDAARNTIDTERNRQSGDNQDEMRSQALLNSGATQGVAMAGMRPELRGQYTQAGVQSGQAMRGAQATPGAMNAMQNPSNPFNPLQTMREVGDAMPASYTEQDFLSSRSPAYDEKVRHTQVVEAAKQEAQKITEQRAQAYMQSVQNNAAYQDARMKLGEAGLEHRKEADALLNTYRNRIAKAHEDRNAVLAAKKDTYGKLPPLLRPLMTMDKEFGRQERLLEGEISAVNSVLFDANGNQKPAPSFDTYNPGELAAAKAYAAAQMRYDKARAMLGDLHADPQYQYVKEQLPVLRDRMKELDPKAVTGRTGKPVSNDWQGGNPNAKPAVIQGKGWSLTPK